MDSGRGRAISHTNSQQHKHRRIFGLFFVIVFAAGNVNLYGQATFSVFRPKTLSWHSNQAGAKRAFSHLPEASSTDVLVPADYDGDGITDYGIWKPESGIWSIKLSSDDQLFTVEWGTIAGAIPDVPVPADYDGDGLADIAVWRPVTGTWYVLNSSKKHDQTKATIFPLGKSGDIPVQADYDGDKRADFAVFRAEGNKWLIAESRTNASRTEKFGNAGTDVLVPADYTGDGRADLAVYRRDAWFVLESETGETEPFYMGFADAVPVPADYDDDGRTDFAVFRSGIWYIYESSQPRFRTIRFGDENDVPLNSIGAKK
ncbi:MAG: VCBS repeat-containing protein [Saprospiraceae bacterium]|nr:VCBS repeat-containing protein [Pyrinomonadaceae bacterium]